MRAECSKTECSKTARQQDGVAASKQFRNRRVETWSRPRKICPRLRRRISKHRNAADNVISTLLGALWQTVKKPTEAKHLVHFSLFLLVPSLLEIAREIRGCDFYPACLRCRAGDFGTTRFTVSK